MQEVQFTSSFITVALLSDLNAEVILRPRSAKTMMKYKMFYKKTKLKQKIKYNSITSIAKINKQQVEGNTMDCKFRGHRFKSQSTIRYAQIPIINYHQN